MSFSWRICAECTKKAQPTWLNAARQQRRRAFYFICMFSYELPVDRGRLFQLYPSCSDCFKTFSIDNKKKRAAGWHRFLPGNCCLRITARQNCLKYSRSCSRSLPGGACITTAWTSKLRTPGPPAASRRPHAVTRRNAKKRAPQLIAAVRAINNLPKWTKKNA